MNADEIRFLAGCLLVGLVVLAGGMTLLSGRKRAKADVGSAQEKAEEVVRSGRRSFGLWAAVAVFFGVSAGYGIWQFRPDFRALTRGRVERPFAAQSGSRFTDLPRDPYAARLARTVRLPSIPGGWAVWGATGVDDRGHLWFGISARGLPMAAAHLCEINLNGVVIDHGSSVEALKECGVHREGEGQSKLHSKIIANDDGAIYFTTMDEYGEKSDGTKLPMWGSHIWRFHIDTSRWEHLLTVPEGLIALTGGGRWVYALGYFGHVVYQYDTTHNKFRSVTIGSMGGHVSRNFFADARGHVYVPKVDQGVESAIVTLVECNSDLQVVGESRLQHYLVLPFNESHGIIGVTYLADESIVFATHRGYLYHVVPPDDDSAATVRELGWFHPEGPTYSASLFTYSGTRYLVGAAKRPKESVEWLVYDLESQESQTVPFLIDGQPSLPNGISLYGSTSRDTQGRFLLGGVQRGQPMLVLVDP